MAVFVSNIVINCGADFKQVFELEDVITNSESNLSNKSISSQLRKHYGSTRTINFDSAIIGNPIYGKIQIGLASSITSTIKGGRYLYDIIIEDTVSGEKTRVVEGSALVREGVTRE